MILGKARHQAPHFFRKQSLPIAGKQVRGDEAEKYLQPLHPGISWIPRGPHWEGLDATRTKAVVAEEPNMSLVLVAAYWVTMTKVAMKKDAD